MMGNRWGPDDDDIDYRARKGMALLVFLFWVGVILLIGYAGAHP